MFKLPSLENWNKPDEGVYDLAQAADEIGAYNWFRNVEPPKDCGYSWWENETVEKLRTHKITHSRVGHSGASLACTFRILQYIARNGFDKWNNEINK
tara:strand:- start:583 stop:873 length:291 start_codon:yes stop_codon:yes gene_type:complete